MQIESPPQTFGEATALAQEQHQEGCFAEAVDNWRLARRLADNDFEDAQSRRGEASSTFRRGWDNDTYTARVLATGALVIHRRLLQEEPENAEAVRQVPESVRVLGRIRLLPVLERERTSGQVQSEQLDAVRLLFREWGDPAMTQLRLRRGKAGPPDQHEINYWPVRAAVEAFAPAGSHLSARRYADQAVRLAAWSEQDSLPTAAHISAAYSRHARRTARLRAQAARTIVSLATPHMSLRRKGALWIATRDQVL